MWAVNEEKRQLVSFVRPMKSNLRIEITISKHKISRWKEKENKKKKYHTMNPLP